MNRILLLLILTFVGLQTSAQNDFITTWKTDNVAIGSSNATSIIIPTLGSGYNYDVSWKNDGVWETGFTGNASHDYGTAGTYTVAIRGDFPRIYFNNTGDRTKILSIEQWGTNAWTSMGSAFLGCRFLVGNATDIPDLSNVTDMSSMFKFNWLFNGDVSNWDVSNVTNMASMFTEARVFNQDVGSWDVSNVTNMHQMFYRAIPFNQDIGNWNVGNVTDISQMFRDAPAFNQNIGGWNVSNVTNMSYLFNGASSFNQDIGNWNVSNVTNMRYIFFSASSFNQDIGNWIVNNVTNMEFMFNSAISFNQDIGNWNVSNVTDMNQIFYWATAFNQDIGSWDVSNLTNMSSMFGYASSFNQDIGNWNVSNVTYMTQMFYLASSFNQDIGNWDVSNVTSISSMFSGALAFDQDIGNWDVSKVTFMNNMFKDVTLSTANYDALLNGWNSLTLKNNVNFSGGNSTYCNGEAARDNMITTFGWTITDGGFDVACNASDNFITTWKTDNLCIGCSNSTSIIIPTTGGGYSYDVSWKNDGVWETGFTGNASHDYGTAGTYTVAIRGNFPRIYFNNVGDRDKILSIEQWGTNTWSSMGDAFMGCRFLVGNATDVPDLSNVTDTSSMFKFNLAFNGDISNWDVSNVTNMASMFTDASSFNQDIGNWNVSNVTNMNQMFHRASAFNQDIGNWDVSNVTDISWMFRNAFAFNQNISGWNMSNKTNMEYLFYNAHAFNGDISNWDVGNVINMSWMFWNAYAFNQDMGNWDVGNVTNMSYMFTGATAFNQDIGNWNVSSVTNMSNMFWVALAFDQDLGNWDVSAVTHAGNMFRDATLSTANYDALLNGWNSLTLQNNVSFSGGKSKYCTGKAARENMITTFGWAIIDWGLSSPPVAICQNITVALDANGNVTITGSDVDNGSSFGCTGSGTLSVSPNTFTCSDIGNHIVTLTVTDANGTESTCTSTVTVVDSLAPIANCTAPFAIQLDANGSASITVSDIDNGSVDNCGIATMTIDKQTFNCADVGANTVILTVTDVNGNVSTCSTIVTVEDIILPVIACPSNITANTDPNNCYATVNFPMAIAIDNCGIDSVVQTAGLPSGSQFPVGTTTIEFTATDINGNASVCSFIISVIDNEAPVAVCQNITIQLDASGNASITAADVDGGSTDQCGVASIAINKSSFNCSDVGNNNVTLTVTDIHGNIGTCIAVVTVEDVTAPVVACQDITVELDPITGTITIMGTDIDNGSSDACGIASYDLDIDTFDCSNIGANTVVLTVTDVNGNSATCTAIVTIEDNTSPVLVCQDFTLELGPNGTATLNPSDVIASNDDACGILTVAVDIVQFSCADIGTPVTVQVFSQDNNGNLSTCTAIVTVVDNLAPVVTCPADQTVDPGVGHLYYIVPDYFALGEATAVDNCTDPLALTTQNPAPGTALSDGVYTITLTATDDYGNIGSCDFELTVESILGVGNNDLTLNGVTLYPVPTKNILNIGNPQSIDLERMDIYDLRGRLVLTTDLRGMGTAKPIDVGQLETAVYTVRIIGKEGQITKRMLKE